jgi:hypothetical protein
MWILLRLTLIVTTLCTAAIGMTQWMTRQQPPPVLTIFTNPDGTPCDRPCLFGVQPGLTSFDRAVELLRAHPFTASFEPNLAGDIFRQGSTRVIIAWGLGDDRVSSIELVIPNHPDWGSLGQIIAVLGSPDHILIDGKDILSYYRAGQLDFVHAHRQAGHINPDDELVAIVVQEQASDASSYAVPWHGFSAIERYRLYK